MERELLHTSDNIDAYWYPTARVLLIIYKGELVPESTFTAYKLGGEIMAKYGVQQLRGVIGDFSRVTRFPNANLTVAHHQSKRLNQSQDLSHVAVALLVSTLMQEKFVWMTAKTNGTDYRSKIVRSMKDAFDYIDTYRKSFDAIQEQKS